jgi:hypothetical protein
MARLRSALRSSRLAILPLGAAAALLAGCGGAGAVATGTAASHGSTLAAAPPSAPAQAEAAPAERSGAEGPGAVPDEVGRPLATAERELHARHVPFRVIPAHGAGAGVSERVCATNPTPRTHLESGTIVRLIVARSCR